jgi:hypothetical protein
MHDGPERADRRDVLTLAMGVLGTAADLQDAGASIGDQDALRNARQLVVQHTTPPAGTPQRPSVARAAAEVLQIIDAALGGSRSHGRNRKYKGCS